MKYIRTLTGLRGLAALIVFISHAANESLAPACLGSGFGQIGVMLFFVLSGFLMAHVYIERAFDHANVRDYVVSRVARVFPLYWLLLLASVIISNYIDPDFYYGFHDAGVVVRSLLFMEAPYVFWTIPVEVQFYAVFLGFWYLRKKNAGPISLCLYVSLTIVPSILIFAAFSGTPKIVSVYSYAFFLGVATSFIHDKINDSDAVHKIASIAGAPLLVLLFLNLPFLREEYGLALSNNGFLATWGDPWTWTIIYCLFVCATLNVKSLRVLKTKPFQLLGEMSYSFYLLHYPVLVLLKQSNLPWPVSFLVAFMLTSSIAAISYFTLERPIGRTIKNHFGKGQAARASWNGETPGRYGVTADDRVDHAVPQSPGARDSELDNKHAA